MSLLAGACSFDDSWAPDELAAQLARDTCRYPHLKSRPLVRDRRVVCYAIERHDQHGGVTRIHTPGNVSAFVLGDIASPDKDSEFLPNALSERFPASLFDLNGCWTAIAYDQDTQCLRVAADMLGCAWVYIARWEKGYVFCSDFGALVANYPGALTPDYETSLVTLGINYSPDDKTCFEEITILPPGQLVELSRDGIKGVSQRQPAYGDKYAALSTRNKYELLDALFARVGRDWCVPFGSDLLISLSGGFDSRYGLAVALDHGITPRCLTFGHPRSTDARKARALCKQLGLDFRLFSVKTTSWDVWQRSVEQSGSAGGFQWANGWAEDWLALLRQSGSHVLLGFLGDALSGKHLVQYSPRPESWLDNWERWSLDEGWSDSPLLRPEASTALRDCVRTRLSRTVRERSFAFPHQQALHLDWFGRQRRFVAAQRNLMARFLTPVPFFYTDYMLEFWGNLPFDDLRDQALYLNYARHRFPAMFDVRRRARLHERAWGALTHEVTTRFPRTKEYFRASEIDITNIITHHKPRVVSVINTVEPLMGRVFDYKALLAEIDAFPNTPRISAVQLSRLVNVCILLHLSMSRPRGVPLS